MAATTDAPERRRIVITGIGVVNASGVGVTPFWHNVRAGSVRLGRITRFDATGFPVGVAGEVTNFEPAATVPRRMLAKTDRFTHFSLAAGAQALGDATVDLDKADRTRVGVWYGNNTGGWDLCERGFAEYYGRGADVVNPWQATAWFLAAPQGFTTIRYGILGRSKSFSGDRASGATAFYHGFRSIAWGHNDMVLAGGCEAPISPLSLLCFHAGGDVSESLDHTRAYRPFDPSATGLVVGEGGAVLVLEDAEHAEHRGSRPYLEVLGGAQGSAPRREPGEYAAVIRRALDDAGCRPADIDLVLCDGAASRSADQFELAALATVFTGPRPVPVSAPKAGFGHLYGAAFGTDVVCAVLAAAADVLPPTPGLTNADLPARLEAVPVARAQPIRHVLVTTHSRYGGCVALVFRRPDNARALS